MAKRINAAKRRPAADATVAANERMRLYCAAHPGSPSAIRCPHLFVREQLWIALLGPNAEQGIVGIGPSVEDALRDFDAQYLGFLQMPAAEQGRSDARTTSTIGYEADAVMVPSTLHQI